MVSEKPVVASDVEGISDFIKNGTNGLLIPPNSPEELAKAVNFLLANSEYASKLGKNGREIVKKNFDFDAISERCLKIYRKLV